MFLNKKKDGLTSYSPVIKQDTRNSIKHRHIITAHFSNLFKSFLNILIISSIVNPSFFSILILVFF
jgi:hypothetical protein